MPKIDWDKIAVVEEWTPHDPSDSNAVAKENEAIQCLSTLILKAFRRHQLARAKQVKRSSNASEKETGE